MTRISRRVIVTGGAGYIGSVTTARLVDEGYEVLVYDDLSHGHRDAVPGGAELVVGDVLDTRGLSSLCAERRFDGAIHFAGLIQVGESVRQPARYERVNVDGSASLVKALLGAGCRALVFSSSAAVYGAAARVPIDEEDPPRPLNPYGASKASVERMLQASTSEGLQSIAMRYFNAAGASLDGRLGERHDPESHLIPLALAAASGSGEMTVYGDDWPTPDGTCVRDYVHVEDLASAHVLALASLLYDPGRPRFRAYNVGTGRGHTVLEVLRAIERAVGGPVPRRLGPRREGDVAVLVASVDRIRCELGWTPRSCDLEAIASSAWRFTTREKKRSQQEGK